MTAAEQADEPSIRRGWLVTFVDLLCLLLAFFVMMSAMQKMDAPRWAGIAGSLSRSLDPDHSAWNAKPRAERNANVVLTRAASDLSYLEAVLLERARDGTALSGVTLRRGDDWLAINLPDNSPAETVTSLAMLLGNFGNAVAIRAYGRDGRIAAMERAVRFAATFTQAGYPRDVSTSGLAGRSRLELVVRSGRTTP